MPRRERDLNLELIWRQRVRQHRASGLSVREFCRRHQITECSFHYWRRIITQRDGESAATRSSTPAFVPVTIVDPPVPPRAAIDVLLAAGRRLRVRPGCERELLAMVLDVLEARAC